MQVYHDFFWYPDPDQRFLIRIRIRIRILTIDTDPTGSGSETLNKIINQCISWSYRHKAEIVRKAVNQCISPATSLNQPINQMIIHRTLG